MKIEKVFVEFCGCPTTDKKVGLRKSSIEKFESDFPEIEVIEFVAKWKYDSLLAMTEKLVGLVEAFKFYFEALNEGRHGYAQDKTRSEINQALAEFAQWKKENEK